MVVATHFKSYQSISVPSIYCSSMAIDSSSTAPSPLKNALYAKGKSYKSISLCRSFKKVCRSDVTNDSNLYIPLASLIQSVHAGTSSGHLLLLPFQGLGFSLQQ